MACRHPRRRSPNGRRRGDRLARQPQQAAEPPDRCDAGAIANRYATTGVGGVGDRGVNGQTGRTRATRRYSVRTATTRRWYTEPETSIAIGALDDNPQHNWPETLLGLLGHPPNGYSNQSVYEHGIRAGDKVQFVAVTAKDLPGDVWKRVARMRVLLCYSSVFDEHWTVTDDHLGGTSTWTAVDHCPKQDPRDVF